MKSKLLNLALVYGIFLASAIAAHAQAVTIYRYSGRGATASFLVVDGCNVTNIHIQFAEIESGSLRLPSQSTLAYADITQVDSCTGEGRTLVTNPNTFLPEGAVQVGSNLKSASLNTAVELLDPNTGNSLTVNFNLAWKAINGPPNRSSEHDHYYTPFGFTNVNTRSVDWPAVASGSVFLEGVNITPSPTSEARLEQQLQGSVVNLRKAR